MGTHFTTLPRDLTSAPRWNGRNDIGSSPVIISSVWSHLDKPSMPVAFILLPEMCRTCSMKPPAHCALYRQNTLSLSSLLVEWLEGPIVCENKNLVVCQRIGCAEGLQSVDHLGGQPN